MTALLEARALRKSFALPTGRLQAVDGVDLHLERGETLAVVGESGCGKSTLGRLLLRLQEPDGGAVLLDGVDVAGLRGAALRAMRRRLQVVFQDPFSSLDPRQRVRDVLTRPMRLHGLPDPAARAAALMERVGLSPAQLALFPHQFSGGQRQRIAIARALSVGPEAIVCDEPVSALDVSVQAQIVNLLADLQRDTGVALLFISHDLAVVRQLAHRVAVMYAGRVVETGPAPAILGAPAHPYTRALLLSVPRIGARAAAPAVRGEPTNLTVRGEPTNLTVRGEPTNLTVRGEPPDMSRPPPGCRFASRCPHAQPRCGEDPPLRPLPDGRAAACHFAEILPPFERPADEALGGGTARRVAAYRSARAGGGAVPCA